MEISGTYVAYLHLCHRKLWLHANGIRLENASNNVFIEEGKLIGETAYGRRSNSWRELEFGFLKIDFYDPQTNTVREVKKSPKLEHAHIAQVKYYLYALERQGVRGARGVIEYPKQRRSREVPPLTDADKEEIRRWEEEIEEIVSRERCPKLVKKPYCKHCAFRDFCYI